MSQRTDDDYERQRRVVEEYYWSKFHGWSNDLEKEQARPRVQISKELADMCEGYLMQEAIAYTALLKRSGIPPSQAVDELHEHEKLLLDQTNERKWRVGLRRLKEVSFALDPTEWASDSWSTIENSMQDFVRNELEARLWTRSDNSVSELNDAIDIFMPSVQATLTDEENTPARTSGRENGTDPIAAERKALLKAYKDECKENGIRVTNKMIAEAARRTWHERTPVQWWLRNDARSTPGDDAAIRRVLQQRPHLNNLNK